MRRWLPLLIALPAFVACTWSDPPVAVTPPDEVTEPAGATWAVAATPPRVFRPNWGASANGAAPPDFVDVRREGHSYSWLYDGGWRITKSGTSAVLSVPYALTNPREPLTFQRYKGAVFGSNGALPPRYRITTEARSLGGSTRFNGYGEVAIQVVYVSPVTYLEVLQTDQHLLVWEAKNAPPMQGAGWRMLARVSRPAKLGEWVRFGAEVNRRTNELTLILNGQPVAEVKSDLATMNRMAWFTLRATGNKEDWRNLEVREVL